MIISTIPPEGIPQLMLNPWILVFYGWLLYNFYQVINHRKYYDIDKSGHLDWDEFKFYLKCQAWPIILSVLTIPIGVYFAEEIWSMLNNLLAEAMPFTKVVYILMGGLSAVLQWIVKKILKMNFLKQ